MRPRLDEPRALSVARDQASLALGLVGIVTFAGSFLSVTWLPTRLDVLLTLATAGLLCLVAALALGRD
jgi:hypothetical protein